MISLGWEKLGKQTPYRAMRYKLNLTRHKMAEKLDITLGAYHHIEMGNVFPSPKVLFKTLEVFDVSVEELKRYFFEREEHIKAAALRPDRRTGARKR